MAVTVGMGASGDGLLERLEAIVGRRHLLRGARTRSYVTGYRTGEGEVVAVVRPGSLVELWRAARACVQADHILILQAANTGLTGGSTPNGAYDRPVVLINTLRLKGVRPVRGGTQVVCLPGAALHEVEAALVPLGREPHSVIGSSCIGASVVGGVCNNSGGALVQRGPAYTEYAVFARIDETGELRLHNHLGVSLPEDPEAMLEALEAGAFDDRATDGDQRAASAAAGYDAVVRDVEAATPARFNADPRGLYEASGSAGRVIVFAVRLDTFPAPQARRVFYVGTNDVAALGRLRRVLLAGAARLPTSAEYIHRDAFDLADAYGRDTVTAIRWLGTSRLPLLYGVKTALDDGARRLGLAAVSDRLLQAISRWLPDPLPARMRVWRERFEHHLILTLEDDAEASLALVREALRGADADLFECAPEEGRIAALHRFAVAGAAVRWRAVSPSEVGDIVALDLALPRNAEAWFEVLPAELETDLVARLYYGHFLCHVFHQDYVARPGVNAGDLKRRLLAFAAARGAQYPAEHNVGHQYVAAPALVEHYRRLDPANALNPGIGKTSRKRGWA